MVQDKKHIPEILVGILVLTEFINWISYVPPDDYSFHMSPLDFFQPIIVFLTSALAAFLLLQNPSLATKKLFITIQLAVIALDILLVTVVSLNFRLNFAGMLDQIAFSLLVVVMFSRLILIYRAMSIATDWADESLAP
jgi:hypothetical protein